MARFVTVLKGKQQCILYLLLSCLSLSTVCGYRVLHNNAFMVRFMLPAKVLLYVTYQFFNEIIFQLVFSSHAKYKSCIETKECLFADGLNLTYSLVKEIVMARKWLRSFSVFMSPSEFYVIRRN